MEEVNIKAENIDVTNIDSIEADSMDVIDSDMADVNINNVGNTEIGMSKDYQFDNEFKEQNGGGVGSTILTIVIIACVALGIFLGILAGKRSANK